MTMPASSARKSKVFISYKHGAPDEPLAAQLMESLEARGHTVFWDRKSILPGVNWPQAIEDFIKSCDYLIVLLTAASANSEAVKGEIDMAKFQAQQAGGRPVIVPVRLNYKGNLPYSLHYLSAIQYAYWEGDADTERLTEQLLSVIETANSSLLAAPEVEAVATSADSPPAYAAALPAPGGGLDIDDPWYVPRDTDASAFREIALRGSTIVIMGPRQMGKSSLLVRTLDKATQLGKRCALIDFQLLGNECLEDKTIFFKTFASLVCEALDLPLDVEPFWGGNLPDQVKLTSFLEKQVLKALDTPLVLAIDEADVLFQSDFMYDFFATVRAWHGKRAVSRLWKNLDLVLVSSTEPYFFIDRAHQSPFNVGHNIRLNDFSRAQVEKVNESHASLLNPAQLSDLYALLNGQPYLTRKAFYVLNAGTSPEELYSNATDSRGPFGDHLRYYLLSLTRTPDLIPVLKKVCMGNGCSDINQAYRLESAGLVKVIRGDKVIPRCDLYAQYFRENL